MFNLALQNLAIKPNQISNLNSVANKSIKVRGFDHKSDVPVDLSNPKWFLSINQIVNDYCPTDRFMYLEKIKRTAQREKTWESLVGNIIDDLYAEMITGIISYLRNVELEKLNLFHEFSSYRAEKLSSIDKKIKQEKDSLLKKPNQTIITNFLKDINKIMIYEHQLAHTIVNYVISLKGVDINLKSEVDILFPYTIKPKINPVGIGFTRGQEPDFIFDNQIVGDVKTGEWRQSFLYTLAAYALAYEREKNKPLNLGIVVNPVFNKKRPVPLYTNFRVILIQDYFRNAVLIARDKKLLMIKTKSDPGVAKNESDCVNCGYYKHCWDK